MLLKRLAAFERDVLIRKVWAELKCTKIGEGDIIRN